MSFNNLTPIDVSEIVQLGFAKNQYLQGRYKKKQIVLHHTVSWPTATAVKRVWESDARRVATCIVIDGNGIAHQLFSSKYWAGHIGNTPLDKISIGIEIVNWGGLKYKNGDFYNYYKRKVKNVDVIEYDTPYRGYTYFQRYTEEQLRTVGKLLLYWHNAYGISLDYNDDIWDISDRALSGESGVFLHTSYRSDKSDLHPQPEVIEMLKTVDKISKQ